MNAQKRLIINADDFGQTLEINRGILESMRDGIVTNATMLTNFPAFGDAVRLAKRYRLPVGVHLNLVEGKALSGVSSLTDKKGDFYPVWTLFLRLSFGLVRRADLVREITMQIEKLERTGVPITHIDGHQHAHMFPLITRPLIDVMRRKKLSKMRWSYEPLLFRPQGERFLSTIYLRKLLVSLCSRYSKRHLDRAGIVYPDALLGMSQIGVERQEEMFLAILRKVPPGTAELLCHPGYNSAWLRRTSRHNKQREGEILALTSEKLKQSLRDLQIAPISYSDMRGR